MNASIAHTTMLAFSLLFAFFGWNAAHKPERALRVFTFGTEPIFGKKLGIKFFRLFGWFCFILFAFGAIFYLILIPLDILRSH
jgi:TRAP-type C4-dicarboxylate transport system permease small subunit